jgi:ATP-dependent RNA helicase DeaD
MEVALAAVKLAHAASGGPDDEEDIPDVVLPLHAEGPARNARPGRNQRAVAGGGPGMTRLYVSLGREAKLRPQDLVGAITGETSLSGRDIGAIEISGRFSLIDVSEGSADEVVESLHGTKIRGRRATVRRERF